MNLKHIILIIISCGWCTLCTTASTDFFSQAFFTKLDNFNQQDFESSLYQTADLFSKSDAEIFRQLENEVQQFEGEFFGADFGAAFPDSTQHSAAFPDASHHGEATFSDASHHGEAGSEIDPDAETVIFEPKFVPAGMQGLGNGHYGNPQIQPTAEATPVLSQKEQFDQIYNAQAKTRSNSPRASTRTSTTTPPTTTPAATTPSSSTLSTTTEVSRVPKIFTDNPKVLDPFTDSYTEIGGTPGPSTRRPRFKIKLKFPKKDETNSRDKKDVDDGEINKLDFSAAAPTDLQAAVAASSNSIPDINPKFRFTDLLEPEQINPGPGNSLTTRPNQFNFFLAVPDSE